MPVIPIMWHEVAAEPVHESNMAGVVWMFFEPGRPIGVGLAPALLDSKWDVCVGVNRRLQRAAVGGSWVILSGQR